MKKALRLLLVAVVVVVSVTSAVAEDCCILSVERIAVDVSRIKINLVDLPAGVAFFKAYVPVSGESVYFPVSVDGKIGTVQLTWPEGFVRFSYGITEVNGSEYYVNPWCSQYNSNGIFSVLLEAWNEPTTITPVVSVANPALVPIMSFFLRKK